MKTCEPTQEVRECRAPKDWSILALQNSRTGKAHYLVICRCPTPGYLGNFLHILIQIQYKNNYFTLLKLKTKN